MRWACPKCGMNAKGHDQTLSRELNNHDPCVSCCGFICGCETDTADGHGEEQDDPCLYARCFHCDWEGRFPPLPKKLLPWQKKAFADGWTPPKGFGS